MTSMKMQLTELINQSPQYVIDPLRVPIYFVDNPKDWAYCATRLLHAELLGFDTETRPTWSKYETKRKRCALLQIAVRDVEKKEEVFLLDLLHLAPTVYNSTLTRVFVSTKTIKIGQNFYHDLQELARSYPHVSCFRVCKQVVEVNDLSIALTGPHDRLSLQKLVFFYMHQKLAKTQQTSNWERRPLTTNQVHYAAADALVLLHLYDELLGRIQNQRQNTKNMSFRLADVTNVLGINLAPKSPKCLLCLQVFDTELALRQHRKKCLSTASKLWICAVCHVKCIGTEKVMGQHVKRCCPDQARPTLQVRKRKRSLPNESKSDDHASSPQDAATQSNMKKRRKGDSKAAKNVDVSNLVPRQEEKKHNKGQNNDDIRQALAVNTQSGTAIQMTVIPSCRDRNRKKRKLSKLPQSTAQLNLKKRRKGETIAAKTVDTSTPVSKQEEKKHTKGRKKGGKKLKRQALAPLTPQVAAEPDGSKTSQAPSSRERKYREQKRRKMSMESSLLASDTLWSKISSDATNLEVA
ncbi:hypothetical protein PsorP6_005321 [Peronosclerospora sorghi]|uniref:Uncharacterized protein n=1 Tax=Peronosclerospora sorghi TaxID=230839 RepID=A0ACC0W4X4_9STRA|nr:hypothetical protein PsorP6_005321 [Peronosclerospora sorghi]